MFTKSFHQLITGMTTQITGLPLGGDLDCWFSTGHCAGSAACEAFKQVCRTVAQDCVMAPYLLTFYHQRSAVQASPSVLVQPDLAQA